MVGNRDLHCSAEPAENPSEKCGTLFNVEKLITFMKTNMPLWMDVEKVDRDASGFYSSL